jgi:hypothetical protein
LGHTWIILDFWEEKKFDKKLSVQSSTHFFKTTCYFFFWNLLTFFARAVPDMSCMKLRQREEIINDNSKNNKKTENPFRVQPVGFLTSSKQAITRLLKCKIRLLSFGFRRLQRNVTQISITAVIEPCYWCWELFWKLVNWSAYTIVWKNCNTYLKEY